MMMMSDDTYTPLHPLPPLELGLYLPLHDDDDYDRDDDDSDDDDIVDDSVDDSVDDGSYDDE